MSGMSEKIISYLQEIRVKRNITQETLAKTVGVTRQTIISIERGNYTPSVLLALKIAKYFDTRVEKLFTIER